MWTDSHCHLQEFIADNTLADIRSRAAAFGITAFFVNGTSPDDWQQVATLAEDPAIHPHFGLHPWFADTGFADSSADSSQDWQTRLKGLLLRFPRAGIGEIGLDLKLTDTPYEHQREIFQRQLDLARALKRPCTIHAVGNVWEDLLDDVRASPPPRFLLHAWGGGTHQIKAWCELGAFFSFGGQLCRTPPSKKLEETLRQIPLKHILLETDAPWQDPRGKDHRSEPAQILAVAERVARIKNIPLETLRIQTEINAERYRMTNPV